jgi:hypothetical protein
MNSRAYPCHRHPLSRGARSVAARGAQHGVVLLMVLVSIVILLLAAVALVHSTGTGLFAAGNLGFRRDLVNQSGRAISAAMTQFATVSDVTNDLATANYSSTVLPADGFPSGSSSTPTHGIPKVLMNPSSFDSTYPNGKIFDATTQVTLRYVIDRLCTTSGPPDPSTCMVSSTVSDKGGTNWLTKAGGSSTPVYRISVLLIGPRNTQAFVQTTFTQ